MLLIATLGLSLDSVQSAMESSFLVGYSLDIDLLIEDIGYIRKLLKAHCSIETATFGDFHFWGPVTSLTYLLT